jgi:ribosome-binding protein aMBF1 (putative translation factor)
LRERGMSDEEIAKRIKEGGVKVIAPVEKGAGAP